MVNAATRSKALRALGEKVAHVDREAWLPAFSPHPFRRTRPRAQPHPVRDGERTPGKVAIFSTCFVNYNEPGIAHDLVKILDPHPVRDGAGESCCGMPKLEQGDLESVDAEAQEHPAPGEARARGLRDHDAGSFVHAHVQAGAAAPVPHEEEVALVRDAMFDPFEYLMARRRDGLLATEFPKALGKVAYHVPCHSRVQKIGLKTRSAGIRAGHRGHVDRALLGPRGDLRREGGVPQAALKIGRPVFRQVLSRARLLRLRLRACGPPHRGRDPRSRQRDRPAQAPHHAAAHGLRPARLSHGQDPPRLAPLARSLCARAQGSARR